MCQRTASILWLILCLLVGAGVARSQPIGGPDGGTGSIDGLVTDQQGAVVAAAYVTARNIKTAQTFTARSGVDGAFAIQGLEFGDYEVQVQLSKKEITHLAMIALGEEPFGEVVAEMFESTG